MTQGDLTIPSSGVLQIDGTLTVAAGDSLVIESGGQITQGATGKLLVDGVLHLKGGCASGGGNIIVGAGPDTVGGVLRIDGTFTVGSGDTLTVFTGAKLTYGASGHLVMDGVIPLDAGFARGSGSTVPRHPPRRLSGSLYRSGPPCALCGLLANASQQLRCSPIDPDVGCSQPHA